MHPNGPSTDAVSVKLLSATAFPLIDRSVATASKKYLKDITYKEKILWEIIQYNTDITEAVAAVAEATAIYQNIYKGD